MLYAVGTYLGQTPQIEISDWGDDLISDINEVLELWGETLTVKRKSVNYDKPVPVETWNSVASMFGYWQPVSGSTIRAEAGLKIKSDAQIITRHDSGVQAGEKVYRADGITFEYVNYVKHYPNHFTIFLTRTEGQY